MSLVTRCWVLGKEMKMFYLVKKIIGACDIEYFLKALRCPSFLYILLQKSKCDVERKFFRSFWTTSKVLFWMFASFSLIFSPVIIPGHLQRSVSFFSILPKLIYLWMQSSTIRQCLGVVMENLAITCNTKEQMGFWAKVELDLKWV